MSTDNRLTDLLSRWHESRAQGRRLTPEELCQDCPELLPQLRQRLGNLDFLLDTPGASIAAAPAPAESTPPKAPVGPPPTTLTTPGEIPSPEALTAASRYRRVRLHARGGLGEVHLGLDEELRREVALKRIQSRFAGYPEARRRFLREAEVTSRLEHPGVVPVYGLIQDDDGTPCYAMRFIRGNSLHEAIEHFQTASEERRDLGQHRLALRQLLSRFVTVCNTMAYAHSRGILHRDLKPDNVMLGKYGETLVVDWGLARSVERTEEARASGEESLLPTLEEGGPDTHLGQTIGTPAYMSPEQAAGRWDVVGPASDVYSMGATLYTLLTGRVPVSGHNHAEVLQKVQQSDFPRPRQVRPDVPRALEAVCLKAMARRPEDRYASATELAAEVERWLADEPVAAWPEPWWVRAGRWVRRHQTAVAATAAAILVTIVLGSGGAWWLEQQRLARQAEQLQLQARLRQGTESALVEVVQLQGQARWAEARAVLAQADSRLGDEAPDDLRQRLDQARHDLELVAQLDNIRLMRLVPGKDNRTFDYASVDRAYAAAFAAAGLGEIGTDAASFAARVNSSAVRGPLLAALDDWTGCGLEQSRFDWLLAVARQADPDPWRDRYRDSALRRDKEAIQQLANEEAAAGQSSQVVTSVAWMLREAGGDDVGLLRRAHARHPEDFWLNASLGFALLGRDRGEALGYHRAAVALRPNSALARNNLGRALAELGRLPEAEAAYRRAIDLDPTYVYAHHGLGYALSEQGRWKEGEAAYRRAIDRDATFAYPHNGLGLCLFHQGRLEEAKTEFHQAIALDPKAVHPHYNLGGILMGEGRIEEAQAAFRQAIDLDPKYSAPYIGLGDALFRQGRLVEAQEQFRKAIELDPKSALSHINLGLVLANQGRLEEAKEAYQQAVTLGQKEAVELLRQCERRLVLIQRLPAVLKSEDRPTDPEEQLEFAAMCQATNQRRYAASARFYAEAFAQDAKLAANTERHYLYDAACAAALAGCGQGEDAGKLDETERARLRRQAREWLRDHLAYWSKQADSENPKARARVSQALKHWQADTDLAGLRDPEALAKLPDAERDACNQLWADVAALLKQASGGQ